MDIRVTHQAEETVACDALVVGVVQTSKRYPQGAPLQLTGQKAKGVVLSEPAQAIDRLLGGLLGEVCTDGEFKGNLGELITIHPMGKLAAKRVVFVGLGAQEKVNPQALRRASATAARHLQQTGAHEIALALQWQHVQDTGSDTELVAQAQVEGALLGLYTFKKYQHSDTNRNGQGVTKITLLSGADQTALDGAIERGTAYAEATNFARDLVNEPPNVLTPTELANRASTMASQYG